ncbi:hypothetical protein ACFQDE_03540 [Deinococcus caeni]|uniref:hypothetical protein n=1 Tax=Deinococcus caeni TaxID=569127 RepID=UPI00361BE5E6
MVRPALLLVALACAPLLGGCRYAFVPLIPAQVNVDLPARLTNATLTRQGTRCASPPRWMAASSRGS